MAEMGALNRYAEQIKAGIPEAVLHRDGDYGWRIEVELNGRVVTAYQPPRPDRGQEERKLALPEIKAALGIKAERPS